MRGTGGSSVQPRGAHAAVCIAAMGIVLAGCHGDASSGSGSPGQALAPEESTGQASTQATAADYLRREVLITHRDVSNHARIYARDLERGPYVTILPSLGRGVEDFTEAYHCTITTRLVEAGFRVVLIQPRGIGWSTGDLDAESVTMEKLVDDLEATLDTLGIEKVHVVGHAFGNRLARSYATFHTERVDRLALLASGGNFEMQPEAERCLRRSFDLGLPEEERLRMIDCAFFARGDDPRVWLHGWYPALAAAEIHASQTIDPRVYERAGGKPFLLVQGAEDFVAPPDLAGRALARELGDQVAYVEIPHAGHAMTSEQPEAIARQLIAYFRR